MKHWFFNELKETLRYIFLKEVDVKIVISIFILTIFGLTACTTKKIAEVPRSEALWNIISTKCLPDSQRNEKSNPCIEVNTTQGTTHGYVVFKDRVGDLQYLLMPTAKITGMESPEILAEGATNYFNIAWKARSYMEKKRGSKIPIEAMSLAINSQYGRSQNQLHVHISCPNPSVQKQMQSESSRLTKKWSIVPGGILGHQYYAKKISEKDLEQKNAFKQIANEIPDAKEHMGEFGLAMIAVKDKKNTDALVLLTSRVDRSTNNRGSVEEIQDHDCPQLKKNM